MKSLITCCCILLATTIFSQVQITVLHTSGKVYYYAPNQNEGKEIHAGLSLSSEGRLRCNTDSNVKLLCKGKVFEFADAKMHDLSVVAQQAGSGSTLSFISRFWMFLNGSMEGTENEQKLEEHHKQSMENTHAGVKGFATTDFAIRAALVFEGRFNAGEVDFTWSALDTSAYCFQLTRQSDDAVLVKIWTRSNTLRLNLTQLALEPGGNYEWQVLAGDMSVHSPRSRKMLLAYQPETAAKALGTATGQEAFKTASYLEQQLMEAFALEEAGFYYEASKRYSDMLDKNPDNALVRRVYAAFLARTDRLDEAKSFFGD